LIESPASVLRSAAVFAAYLVLAVASAILLILVEPVGAWVFLPYVAYLAYATWWLSSLRRLNAEVPGAAA